MPDVSLLAILAATVAAFGLSAIYYVLLGGQLGTVSKAAASGERSSRWLPAVELLRNLIVVAVVSGLAAQGEIDEWGAGLLLGLALWIGFPFVLWTGAVIHEKTPVKLTAIHAGDWFVKRLVVATVVSAWQ